VIAFFAFPMENAFPFFIASVIAGAALTIERNETGLPIGWTARLGLISATGLTGLLGLAFFYSHFSMRGPQLTQAQVARACHWFPDYWKACVAQVEGERLAGDPIAAEKGALSILARQPRNFVALKVLAEAQADQKKWAEACASYRRYDGLFGGESSLKLQVQAACAGPLFGRANGK
jgi:hypothetical protein